jgi:DNA-directed RNA polymerase subunit beta
LRCYLILGWAAKELGLKLGKILKENKSNKVKIIKDYLNKVYNKTAPGKQVRLLQLSNDNILVLADNLKNGIPMATPVFDGAQETEIKAGLNDE